MKLTDDLRNEYNQLWNASEVIPSRLHEVDHTIDRILAARNRYEFVEKTSGVPWAVIACLHAMECSLRFDQHLHNGDPMEHNGHWARTVNVPAGRPMRAGPWTWEESAHDALGYDGLTDWHDWSVAGTLYKAEAYNGWGSRNHGIHSPYLWGGSNEQQRGKYIRDHVWSPTALTDQIGVATLLGRMDERDLYACPEEKEGA